MLPMLSTDYSGYRDLIAEVALEAINDSWYSGTNLDGPTGMLLRCIVEGRLGTIFDTDNIEIFRDSITKIVADAGVWLVENT